MEYNKNMTEFPKIIWQTHQWEYNELPELYKKTSKTWQIMNPDWEYKYIPNSDMRKEIEKIGMDELLIAFDLMPTWMAKSDIYREAMIYFYGGLWADMDSVCIFPIDKIIKRNQDKEMVCHSPIFQFGFDLENNYQYQDIYSALNSLLSGKTTGYWIPNGIFLGKKNNLISKKIIDSILGKDKLNSVVPMDFRSELYEKYYDQMSLDLICTFHDNRLNVNSY